MTATMVQEVAGQELREAELCPDHLLRGQEEAFARDVERLRARSLEFAPARCPACRDGRHGRAFEKFGFAYDECEVCGTLFMNPRPTSEIIAGYYASSENYQYWAQHIFPASEAARREKIHVPWLRRVRGYAEQAGLRNGILMEVGPGFGTFSALAQASGAFSRVIAVEPTPELATAVRQRGVEVIECRIEDVPKELGTVDIMVAFEVLEHLHDPRVFLAGCRARLRTGGLLILSTPNAEGFDIATLREHSLAVDPEHITLFTPRALALATDAEGFRCMEITTPGRLDAEFVRAAALGSRIDLRHQPLLRRILVDEWDRLGAPFQRFLAEHQLSSHMWYAGVAT
jgi:2-polyprenyl-3-methyl-5-hydroxy-6-metoxy-1,4-benzoquinol methylase